MTFTANQVTSIIVQDKNGTVKGTLEGKVLLQRGDGVRFDVSDGELTLNAGDAYNDENSRYQRKFKVIVNGGTFIDDDGTSMTFSGMPYYIASLGGVKGNYVNNFDFLSNACGQVGIGDSVLVDGELALLDICQACVDCEDYALIVTLMERIEEYQDWDVTRNLDTEAEGGQMALFKQYLATLHYWNYLAQHKCMPLVTVRGSSTTFVVKSGYLNRGDGTSYIVTQLYTFDFEWEENIGTVSFKITDTKNRPIALSGPTLSVHQVDDYRYTATVSFPALTYDQRVVYELVAWADEILVSAELSVDWTDTHIGETITKERSGLV